MKLNYFKFIYKLKNHYPDFILNKDKIFLKEQ